jgi:hypothetical protein
MMMQIVGIEMMKVNLEKMMTNNIKKSPDWGLRLGLILFAPVVFMLGGVHGAFVEVYKMFKEFWNEGMHD